MRVFIILIALACVAQVKLVDDPPVAPAPKDGKITGTITPGNDVTEVYAMNRYVTKLYKAESFDPKTGNFSFRDMPGDAVYDIGVKLRNGRTIEGIDLTFAGARFQRLAAIRRQQLDLPPVEEIQREFSEKDVKELRKYFSDFTKHDFMDLGRVLYLQGQGNRATMLVELLRDPNREFYDQKAGAGGPEIVWRVELWYFLWQHGGWERVANQERVLQRERIPVTQWQKISLEYLPAWSVTVDAEGKSPAAKLQIPEKSDPSTGRFPRTKPEIQTEPNVLGLIDAEKK